MSFPTSYVKLDATTWGVRIPEDKAANAEPGGTVIVYKRDGRTQEVTLGTYQGKNRYGDQVWSLAPQAKPAQAIQAVGDLGGVLQLFDRAKVSLKKPAITLAVPEADTVVRLSIASAKAKVPGSIDVKDNDVFEEGDWGPRRVWLGRVTVDGQYQPARVANGRTEAIAKRLREFACEPAKVAKESATLTGRCVFCNLALGGDSPTAKKSLAVGYGKACAVRYGLPWGEDKLDIGEGA
jgi:hypothetical protein